MEVQLQLGAIRERILTAIDSAQLQEYVQPVIVVRNVGLLELLEFKGVSFDIVYKETKDKHDFHGSPLHVLPMTNSSVALCFLLRHLQHRIEEKSNCGTTPLERVIPYDNIESGRTLLEHGAKITKTTIKCVRSKEMLLLLLEHGGTKLKESKYRLLKPPYILICEKLRLIPFKLATSENEDADESRELRYRVYFSRSLTSQLLQQLYRLKTSKRLL